MLQFVFVNIDQLENGRGGNDLYPYDLIYTAEIPRFCGYRTGVTSELIWKIEKKETMNNIRVWGGGQSAG